MSTKYVSSKSDEYSLSDLQKGILTIICTTRLPDYRKLQEKTHRTRTTIHQSLKPLLRHHYITVKTDGRNQKNSKLMFTVSHKGLFYSIAYLGIDYDEILKIYIENINHVREYELFKSVPDYAGRKEFLHQTAKLIMRFDPFDSEGMFSGNLQDIMDTGFRLSLLESIKNRNFRANNFFGDLTVEQLTKICSPLERKELIKFLKSMNTNLSSVISFFEQNKH